MNIETQDTIAAISTPPGENGIGVVRLSGPEAISIADKIFMPRSGKRVSRYKSHTIHYGYIKDRRRRVDEALLTVMRAPKTYTRQDVVEINCHSGIEVLREVLGLVISSGARLAHPGEFTKRAFLNGRIDLAQAEAVMDIISSRTADSLRLAQRQLQGEISSWIRQIRLILIESAAEVEADVNFPEEEINASRISKILNSLKDAGNSLSGILKTADKGMILKEGATVVICGKPNVGKSSLLNSLLRYERAIVAPLPGTTRDFIEESVNIKGIPFKIVDTAGITEAKDELTRESVSRSKRYLEIADLILLVLDGSGSITKADTDIIKKVQGKKKLVVINKADLRQKLRPSDIRKHLAKEKIIKVSAVSKKGIEELADTVHNIFWSGSISSESILISSSRHIEAIKKALDLVLAAIKNLRLKNGLEYAVLDIKDAADELGAITGESVTEDLLDSIFNRFCIGK